MGTWEIFKVMVANLKVQKSASELPWKQSA